MNNRVLVAAMILCGAFAASTSVAFAAGCPSEPGWNYTDKGPDYWNSTFMILCGEGVRQSPINIVASNVVPAKLPKLTFHYNVADVVTLDHDDQTLVNHGAGNFITIGNTKISWTTSMRILRASTGLTENGTRSNFTSCIKAGTARSRSWAYWYRRAGRTRAS